MTNREKYIVGFFNGANGALPGVKVCIKQAGQFYAFEVVETNPNNQCTRTNGYATSFAVIDAMTQPEHAGNIQGQLVVNDLNLAPWVCP